MYSAIDQVMDKIEKQVKRHISKTRNRRSENINNELGSSEDAAALSSDEPAIEVEKMFAKPMDTDEAAMQLNISRRDFLVFMNAKSREINVIYKRGDGNLGLIEPVN